MAAHELGWDHLYEVLADAVRAFDDVELDPAALRIEIARRGARALDGCCCVTLLSDPGHAPETIVATREPGVTSEDLDAFGRVLAAAVDVDAAQPVTLGADELRAGLRELGAPGMAERLDVRELISAPLRARGLTLGRLAVVRCGSAAAPFDAEERELIQRLGEHAALALTNARLFSDLQSALAHAEDLEGRQRRLAELARELASVARDPRAMIDLVAQRFCELVGDMCSIRMVVDGALEGVGSYHDRDPSNAAAMRELIATAPRQLGVGLFGGVAASGKTLRIDAVDPRAFADQLGEDYRRAVQGIGILSMLVVPLCVGGKVLGVAGVARSTPPTPYTDAEQKLLEDAAQHAALAITNAQSLAETQAELVKRIRVQRRLQQISELSRELASATESSARLPDLVAKRFSEIIGGLCVVRLVAEDGESFERTGSVHHPDARVVERTRRVIAEMPQCTSEGLAGRVLRGGKPLLLESMAEELNPGTNPFAAVLDELRVTSFVGAPLCSGGRTIGVVTLARLGHTPRFTPDDLAFLEELLAHVSLAVHNSRLIHSARHQLEERLRAEAALQRTEEQFRHAQKMEAIGRLAGGVAHDFNNLLSVILTCSDVLLDEVPASAPARGDLEQIQAAGRRAAELTRQLLAFSRQQTHAPKVLDLNDLVREMLQMIGRVVGEDIVVHTDLVDSRAMVEVDPGHVHQVIMNLVVNARDAMPCGGRLFIQTSSLHIDEGGCDDHVGIAPGDYVMLAIGDTGMGMDTATKERIFEPFFTTKEQGKGTGLGLSTAFGIVEQSGGTMRVASAPGRGATFRIYLPRTRERARTIAVPQRRLSARGDETIMLVEDDAQVRRVVTMILERSGYRVLAAESGAAALELFERHGDEVDLLLTDVVMPEMSGRELADLLVARRPNLRVVYMSGYNDEAILRHRVLAHEVTLVDKPIRPDTLLSRLRETLAAGDVRAQNLAVSET